MATAQAAAANANSNTTAKGYFVDSVGGNDSNAGTSSSVPFKTLARLSTVVLTTGQGIYLKCGDVWRESIALGARQLVNYSVVGAYGTGCATALPRITGSNDYSGSWNNLGNGIWARGIPAGTPAIQRLFIAGSPLRVAQWPNYIAPGNETASTSSTQASSNTSLTVASTDLQALSGQDMVGATALVHTQAWTIESVPVASYVSTTGVTTLAGSTQAPIVAGTPYAFTGKLWMLDAPGEFFQDSTNNLLYLIPTAAQLAAGLNTLRIEGAVRSTGLTIGGRTNLTVSQLQIDMNTSIGLSVFDAPNSQFGQLNVSHNGHTGVQFYSSTPAAGTNRNPQLDSSTLVDNTVVAVDATGSNRVTVSNSVVTDTGTLGWAGTAVAAVDLSDGGIAYKNTVLRSAYGGIRFAGGDNSAVTGNVVTDYCQRLTDCGAIYTWFGTATTTSPYTQSSKVNNNLVTGSYLGGHSAIAGIYLDDFTSGVTVQSNTVAGSPYGVLVHNSSNNVVSGNKLWLNNMASLFATMDQTTVDAMHGNTFTNNQLVPDGAATGTFPALPAFKPAYSVLYKTVGPDLGDITTGSNKFSNNIFYRVQAGSAPDVFLQSASGVSALTAAGWRTTYAPQDAILRSPAAYSMIQYTAGPELVVNGNFGEALSFWSAWYATTPGGSLALTSGSNCVAECASFMTTGITDSLYGSSFNVTANAMYVVNYANQFTKAATIQLPYMSTGVTPYGPIVGAEGQSSINALAGSIGDLINVQSFFHSTSTGTGRINLKVQTPNVPVQFANVSIKNVTGYTTSLASAWSAIAVAPSTGSQAFSCTTLGWTTGCSATDINGNPVTLPVTVPAGSAMILLRADSSWKS